MLLSRETIDPSEIPQATRVIIHTLSKNVVSRVGMDVNLEVLTPEKSNTTRSLSTLPITIHSYAHIKTTFVPDTNHFIGF